MAAFTMAKDKSTNTSAFIRQSLLYHSTAIKTAQTSYSSGTDSSGFFIAFPSKVGGGQSGNVDRLSCGPVFGWNR
jgi:hypothetical protein